MKILTTHIPGVLPRTYSIYVGSRLLKKMATFIPRTVTHIAIITDNTVKKIYATSLCTQLQQAGFFVSIFSFSPGETSKCAAVKQKIEEQLLKKKYDRSLLILAVGGGVVGDLAGFIAATYLRGVSYYQIPTSLLAMVDSSIGGKTAINTLQGKNLIGAFWQPQAVIADLHCLSSLPQIRVIDGFVEALKVFLTCREDYFFDAQKNSHLLLKKNVKAWEVVICRAIDIKKSVVEKDEKEKNYRMILNFGHTIGHAIEKLMDYRILHGHAVAYGILIESKISVLLGLLSESDFLIIKSLFEKLGFKTNFFKKLSASSLIQQTRLDKKTKAGKTRFVLLKQIGCVYHKNNLYAHSVSDAVVLEALTTL